MTMLTNWQRRKICEAHITYKTSPSNLDYKEFNLETVPAQSTISTLLKKENHMKAWEFQSYQQRFPVELST